GSMNFDTGAMLAACRRLLLPEVKVALLQRALRASVSASLPNRPRLAVNRFVASNPASWHATLLGQATLQLCRIHPSLLCQEPISPHLCFEVRLQGERVVGEIGPYREFLSSIVAEAMRLPTSRSAALGIQGSQGIDDAQRTSEPALGVETPDQD